MQNQQAACKNVNKHHTPFKLKGVRLTAESKTVVDVELSLPASMLGLTCQLISRGQFRQLPWSHELLLCIYGHW